MIVNDMNLAIKSRYLSPKKGYRNIGKESEVDWLSLIKAHKKSYPEKESLKQIVFLNRK
jgi:hypothetical protein